MLDTVPRSMWIRYWFVRRWYRITRHKSKLWSWATWLCLLASLGAYWPIVSMMAGQEKQVTVHTSSLTMAYILFLCYVGFFFQWLVRRYLGKRSQWLRLCAMLGLMVLLLAFLEFVLGIEMRWSQ